MEPIFSPQAQVVGWYKSDAIYDENGHPRAVVRNNAVFTLNGTYLGHVDKGYVRDQRGDAVAFMRGATGAPLVPTPRVIPSPPMTWPLRAAVTPRVNPYAPSPSVRWSLKDWEVFLSVDIEQGSGQPVAEEHSPFVWF